MAGSSNDGRKKLDELLYNRIGSDNAFRSRLLKTPKAALEEVLKTKIPENVKIHVVEEKPGEFFIVVPPSTTPAAKEELSEADLEQVAGGDFGTAISNVNVFTISLCQGSCGCC
jgi:hypothetical protein